jgi:hypothetical protein
MIHGNHGAQHFANAHVAHSGVQLGWIDNSALAGKTPCYLQNIQRAGQKAHSCQFANANVAHGPVLAGLVPQCRHHGAKTWQLLYGIARKET